MQSILNSDGHSELTCAVSSGFLPAYLGFLWMLLLVAYGQRDPNSYYLNKHIENSFTDGFQDVYSYQDFFTWANTTLVKNLYGSYKGAESHCFASACRILKPYLAHTYLTRERSCECIGLVWVPII